MGRRTRRWAAVFAWLALTALAGLGLSAPALGEGLRLERFVRLEGEVQALVATRAGAIIAAGVDSRGRAWAARIDPLSLDPEPLPLPPCRRCRLLDGVALEDGRVVLVGSHQEDATVPARGWVLVMAGPSGRLLDETRLAGRGPTLWRAVDVRFGRLLVGGESQPSMGAEVAGLAALYRLDGLVLEAVWPFEGRAPQAVGAVRLWREEAFLAGGWRFGQDGLGGWLAFFGFKGEPFWQRRFDRSPRFEVMALVPAESGLRLVGHEARAGAGGLDFAPVVAEVAVEQGRLVRTYGPFAARDRMVGAVLPAGDGLLLATTRDQRPDGPERAELLRWRPGGEPEPLLQIGEGPEGLVPTRLIRLADGALLMGGWIRTEAGPRGWLARLVQIEGDDARASDDGGAEPAPTTVGLRLVLECGASGRVRVVLENRGPDWVEVRRLDAATVRLVPAGEAPAPGPVGAVPGRPPDPLAQAPRTVLVAGGRLVLELPWPAAWDSVQAVYSPDFDGYGLGQLLVSPPLRAGAGGCPRDSTR